MGFFCILRWEFLMSGSHDLSWGGSLYYRGGRACMLVFLTAESNRRPGNVDSFNVYMDFR